MLQSHTKVNGPNKSSLDYKKDKQRSKIVQSKEEGKDQ